MWVIMARYRIDQKNEITQNCEESQSMFQEKTLQPCDPSQNHRKFQYCIPVQGYVPPSSDPRVLSP